MPAEYSFVVIKDCKRGCEGCVASRIKKLPEYSSQTVRNAAFLLPKGRLADMVGRRITLRKDECPRGFGIVVEVKSRQIECDPYKSEGGALIPAPGYIAGGHGRGWTGSK